MTILEILKFVAGIATILTGMVSLFWPLRVRGFTGASSNTRSYRTDRGWRTPKSKTRSSDFVV